MSAHIGMIACLISTMPVTFRPMLALDPKIIFGNGDMIYMDKTTKDFAGADTKQPAFPRFSTAPVVTISAATAKGGLTIGAVSAITTNGVGGPVSQALSCFFVAPDGNRTATGIINTDASGNVSLAANITVSQPGWGYTHVAPASFTVVTQADPDYWLLKRQQWYREQQWQELLAARAAGKFRFYVADDDHDVLGDNWDWSITKANVAAPTITTNAQVWTYAQMALAAGEAVRAIYYDNPPLTSAFNGDRPALMVAAGQGASDGSDLKIKYFYVDVDENGNVGGSSHRFIVLDCVTYKSQLGVNNGSSTLLGNAQEAWALAAALDAKTRGFNHVVFISTKDLFNLDNLDGWCNYTVQRNRMLQYLHDQGIPAFWWTGDRHTFHTAMASVATGQSYDCTCVCSCPAGNTGGLLTAYAENIAWDNTNTCVFGDLYINSTTRCTEVYSRDIWTGDVVGYISIPFGQRLGTIETMRASSLLQIPTRKPQAAAVTPAITVPASTVAWVNDSGMSGILYIDGGTVTVVSVSVNGGSTFIQINTTRGQIFLRPLDQVKLTYSAAPTTFVFAPLTA